MQSIYPGPETGDTPEIARALLKIAGPERRSQIKAGTGPRRFEVPDDIAEEFVRLRAEQQQARHRRHEESLSTKRQQPAQERSSTPSGSQPATSTLQPVPSTSPSTPRKTAATARARSEKA